MSEYSCLALFSTFGFWCWCEPLLGLDRPLSSPLLPPSLQTSLLGLSGAPWSVSSTFLSLSEGWKSTPSMSSSVCFILLHSIFNHPLITHNTELPTNQKHGLVHDVNGAFTAAAKLHYIRLVRQLQSIHWLPMQLQNQRTKHVRCEMDDVNVVATSSVHMSQMCNDNQVILNCYSLLNWQLSLPKMS